LFEFIGSEAFAVAVRVKKRKTMKKKEKLDKLVPVSYANKANERE